MKQKRKSIVINFLLTGLILFLFVFYGSGLVHAGDPEVPVCDAFGQVYDPVSEMCVVSNPAEGQLVDLKTFPELIERIINILLTTTAAIAVIFLIIGGFKYITSQGNEEEMESAKKTVKSAIIGIVIIVMSFAIVVIVTNLLSTTPT